MQKIPTIFLRTEDQRHITRDINPACQWVFDGEGEATIKWDGTCVRLDEFGAWWTRREVKPGKARPTRYVEVEFDPNTGKSFGWEPAEQSGRWKVLQEAAWLQEPDLIKGLTYELCGPTVNGNPEQLDRHILFQHGEDSLTIPERTYDQLHGLFFPLDPGNYLEGVVFWHSDGRRGKVKAKDFPT